MTSKSEENARKVAKVLAGSGKEAAGTVRGNCPECAFWDPLNEPGKQRRGQCRRRSPTAVVQPDEHDTAPVLTTTAWPVTYEFDWCGEFEAD